MNTHKINVLILAAGHSTLEGEPGHGPAYPVCLTEKDGVTLLERIVSNASSLENANFTFAMLDEEVRKYHLDSVIQRLRPGAQLVRVARNTRGSACTGLLAASGMDADAELLVISANELVDVNLGDIAARFRNRDLDGGTLVFRSIHPRYSFVKLGPDGLVIQSAQQKPISDQATTGIFWFRRTGDFVEATKSMIRKDAHTGGAFFVCPAFNEMLLKQARIGVESVELSHYHPVKTERQLAQFESAPAMGLAA